MIYHLIDSETDIVRMFNIKPDTTTKNRYYCVMVNPFSTSYDSKVIYGTSEEIVQRKIKKQYDKFKKESAK